MEAELNELGARISKQNADDKRAMISQLTADAEAIDKSIAAGMEEESYKALEGQEKYKADQERKEADKLAEGKRQYVKQLEGQIEEHMKTSDFVSKVKASGDDRTFEVVMSTSDEDRQGDALDQSKWDLKYYTMNPVVLWAHNYSSLRMNSAAQRIFSISASVNGIVGMYFAGGSFTSLAGLRSSHSESTQN
ncbi:MAG TPA: hypothetical protein VGT08_05085 [Terracidiphilus sp.]|nr:hypothetical protein [Terracidiphilus sp.]